jgi:serine/threonine protein kinase
MKVGDKKIIDGKKYFIKELIGKGTFKRAFLAHREDGIRFVILKQVSKSKESNKIFNKEIEIMRGIYSRTNGKCYSNIICPVYMQKLTLLRSGLIITNYIPGIDLSEFIRKYDYKLGDLHDIILNLLKALQVLHETIGYVHLDLKPQNIRINPSTLDVGIVDLGMSCDISEVSCQERVPKGTILYMAPELFTIIPTTFDVRKVDIWAMGCVIYELIFKNSLILCMTQEYPDDVNLPMFLLSTNREEFERNKRICLSHPINYLEKYIVLIEQMVRYENENRPDINELLDFFFSVQNGGGKSQFYGRKSKVMIKVPKNVKKWAKYAFALKRLGFKGALETGWKRAKQLAEKDSIPIEDLRYMRNWYARHRYTSYPGFKEWVDAGKPLDKSWHNKHAILSWVVWGADPAFKWVNSDKVIHLLNKHFDKNYKRIKSL